MATIKSYTDLNQSRKLEEILPLESADMCYIQDLLAGGKYGEYKPYIGDLIPAYGQDKISCWSLAALIGVLPIDYIGYKHYFLEISKMGDNAKPYEVRYFRFKEDWEGANFGRITHISCTSDNLIDACYDMIITLHNQKLL